MVDIVLNQGELAFLGVLAHPQLTRKAVKLYARGVVLFNKVRYPHLHAAWTACMSYMRRNGKAAHDKMVMSAELNAAVEADADLGEELTRRMAVLLNRYMDGDVPDLDAAAALVENLIKLDTNMKIASKITSSTEMEELRNMLDAGISAKNSIAEEAASTRHQVVYHPFRDIERLSVKAEHVRTGINWLDELSNGGGRAGELWLILGITGGGKTQFTVQYACQQALLGRGIVWATYEQPMEGDIADRIIANITEYSLDLVRDRGFGNLPPEVRDKFWDVVSGSDDKLIGLDMSRVEVNPEDPEDNGGMYTVWKHVREANAAGAHISTVIVDWFGAMMGNVAAVTGKDLSKGYRFMAQHEIDIARKMAAEERLMVIFMHQLDTKSQAARPTSCPDMTCAKDMKDMSHYMDLVLAMGKRDSKDICWFASVKARKGNPQKLTLRLNGELVRFEWVHGYQPQPNGEFANPQEAYKAYSAEAPEVTREVE